MKYIKPELAYVSLGVSEPVSVTICLQCPNEPPQKGDITEFGAGTRAILEECIPGQNIQWHEFIS